MLICTRAEVVDRELLVARGDRPGLLERAHRALDGAAPTVRHVVEVRLPAQAMGALPRLIGPLRDYSPHAVRWGAFDG